MLGLLHLARAAGKEVVASWPEPFRVAPHYTFLPGLDLVTKPADFPARPEVMVTFDCGSIGRLGELATPAAEAGDLVVIDHHATNDRYGTINLVRPDVAASAVLVRALAQCLGWPLTRDAALCIYTGVVTDTGRFQYDCTTPDVFALAQELASYELPIAAMSRRLFEEHRFAYIQLAGVALARAELDATRRFVATWLTSEDLAQYGVEIEETEGLIDLVRRASEADVSCVLKETPSGTRVSLRSVSGYDVGALAMSFGGGGHAAAAGFSVPRPIGDVLAEIRAALPVLS
jgi:phosphoesterase RecJ-like protein